MTLHEFSLLDKNNKTETANHKGIYLDNHITKYEKFNLYAINMFFVEVEYNNHLNNIKTFKSGHLLDRYSILMVYYGRILTLNTTRKQTQKFTTKSKESTYLLKGLMQILKPK